MEDADERQCDVRIHNKIGAIVDFGGDSVIPRQGRPKNQSLHLFEAFKCYGDKIHAVEAFMETKPDSQPFGWD